MSRLFYFNPTSEMEIANEQPYYTASKHIELLKKSLSIVPIYLANEGDYIFIDGEYPEKFLEKLSSYSWRLPRIVTKKNVDVLNGVKISNLEPWGWSPSVIKKFENLSKRYEFSFEKIYDWNESSKKMFSRFSGYELCKLLKDRIIKSQYLSIPQIPIIVENLSDLVKIESEMQSVLLIKTPWSASGRGLYKIRDNNEKSYESQWVKAKFKEQKCLFVEPFLNKIADLSFHFKKSGNNIEFVGVNFFKTESDGKFTGCYVNFYIHPDYNPVIIKKEAIDEAKELLLNALYSLEIIKNYDGYIGIDAMFFYDEEKNVKLHPAIEMNLRKTMGLINLHIEKRVSSDSYGFWEIVPMQECSVITPEENRVKDRKLISGIFPLSPVDLGGSVVMQMVLK